MKLITKPIILLLITCFFSMKCSSQIYPHINKLKKVSWTYKGDKLTKKEKIEGLKMLPFGDRVEFIMADDGLDDIEETQYWEFDISGLYYLDLDFDGDLDLLYSGVNGNMRQTATKIYYNQNDTLLYFGNLRDGILDININKNSKTINVYTLFNPCCDSYTSRIDSYLFTAKDSAVFASSISFIGRSHQPITAMPDFSGNESFIIKNPVLYALPTDFRGLSGYFRERSKEVRQLIRENKTIPLIKIKGDVLVNILDEKEFHGKTYKLVVTEELSNLPKMPVSLYEWSEGNGRMLIGWIEIQD